MNSAYKLNKQDDNIQPSFNIYFCFIGYTEAFNCVAHNKLQEIPQEMRVPDHLTCLLRNCMQVKKQQLELDMEQRIDSKLGKEYVKAVYCHPVYCLFNLYAEYIMQNAELDEAQAGIKITRREINNLRYADDTTHNKTEKLIIRNRL